MSHEKAVYTPAPACWCRNCDQSAKAGLGPLERFHAGTRFIVCPDCGNKRCPRGTNHELACTNSNLPGQAGSEWENVKPEPKTKALAAALTARAEKAEASLIKAKDIVEILLPSNTALTARAEKAEARVKELLAELAEQELEKLTLTRELKQIWFALNNATR